MTQPAIVAEGFACRYGQLITIEHIHLDGSQGEIVWQLAILLALILALGLILALLTRHRLTQE